MTNPPARRAYLDVLRGLTVLIMIEAHVIDSWTRVADRSLKAFGYSLVLGGFAAPLFLFLAGVAVPMSAGSKARRSGDPLAASRAVERRGLEIFLLAFLFRFQSFVLSWAPAWTLLKVDILNIMGPGIVVTAWLWGACRTTAARAGAFTAATFVVVFVTPFVRGWAALTPLPDFLEGYLRPVPGWTNFSAFPWIAFLPAGALVGLALDRARTVEQERRANLIFGIGGTAMVMLAYGASFMPALHGRTEFWTSSASFFFLRLGVMVAAIAVCYAWEGRPWARGQERAAGSQQWRPVQALGRHSLFVYWIHVEMVYGVVSLPLHASMSIGVAWLAMAVFSLFILLCVHAEEIVTRWWNGRGQARPGMVGSAA